MPIGKWRARISAAFIIFSATAMALGIGAEAYAFGTVAGAVHNLYELSQRLGRR